MIINFKIFENIGSPSENWKKFWIVDNTDKYFEVRLFKIGMTFEIIEKFKKFLLKNFDEKFRHYYFGYDSKLKKWSYENYNYTSGSNIYVDSFYKFMDHVKITNKDKQNYEDAKKEYENEKYFQEFVNKDGINKYNL